MVARRVDGPRRRELAREPGPFGLGQLPRRLRPDAATDSVCGFCSTGCALTVHLREGQAINLSPAHGYPVNRGVACPKGWEALRVLDAPDRATTPLLRDSSGRLAPVDWNEALRTFVGRFRAIQDRHGAESVAFLGTGQIVTEELALLGALAKFGMGMRHGDGNTRQCMATAVTAYKQSFGFDAPPYTYADLEESDVVVLAGSNLAIAHPILWDRLRRNRNDPAIVVVDPRRTETAMAATVHLALRPKSDLVLLYGIAHLLVRMGGVDRAFVAAHTRGFDDFARHVRDYPPDRVARETEIAEPTLHDVARRIRHGRRVSFWWTMGVNQSHEGTRVAQALIDLALMTGNIGRPGTGANSITGQCNAMGSRLFSNTSSLLGGHDFRDAAHRERVAEVLDIDASRIPDDEGRAYPEIVEGIAEGKIRGLWIVATNASHSWIGQDDFNELLGKLDFLVVQDLYSTTETARRADLLLPAAGWGEKEGTFINSERRIGRVKKVRRAPGLALADFAIFRLVADAWGCGGMFRRWSSPEAVFELLKELTRGRPCDMTGVGDYGTLEALGGLQWPWTEADAAAGVPATERRLFGDGRFFHADGRARFVFDEPRPLPEAPDGAWPFLLLTGRGSAAQWHTQTRTAKSAVLRKLAPAEPWVEIHPDDARELGIEPHEEVQVESRRGRIRVRAFLTPCIARGQLFVPMHDAQTNRLTDPVFDPHSRQPAYKACAVRLRRLAHWEEAR